MNNLLELHLHIGPQDKRTALSLAVVNNRTEAVAALIKAGADLNVLVVSQKKCAVALTFNFCLDGISYCIVLIS